jgi:hypothetical protein
MSIYKIRVEFLVLTDQRKTLFLRWALEGFKSPNSPLQMARPKLSEKAGYLCNTTQIHPQACFAILIGTGSELLSARMRAFLLATSAGWRARLILPRGVLSEVECPVTSKYVASDSPG